MSVCTLPQPVLPDVISVSPIADVALFVAGNYLSLCRRSGQQIWSARVPNSLPVARVSWCPTGEAFSLVYKDHTAVVCSVRNGRPLPLRHALVNVSCVAWSGQNSELSAVGTTDGTLRTFVHGEFDLGNTPIPPHTSIDFVLSANDGTKFTIVQNQQISVVELEGRHRPNGEEVPPELSEVLQLLKPDRSETEWLAQALRLVGDVKQLIDKITTCLNEINVKNAEFCGSIGPQGVLQVLQRFLIFGTNVHLDWIQSLHEQGFRLWYRKVDQLYSELHLFVVQLIGFVEKLLLVLGALQLPQQELQEMHTCLLKETRELLLRKRAVEQEASVLERAFVYEIDRPLNETKVEINEGELLEQLAKNGSALAHFEGLSLDSFQTCVLKATKKVTEMADDRRRALRAQFSITKTSTFEHKISAITQISGGSGGYAVLCEGEVQKLRTDLLKEGEPKTFNSTAVFTSHGDDVVYLDLEQRRVVHSNGDSRDLAFEPLKLAVRRNAPLKTVSVLVLSADCRHYQFVELKEC